MTAAHTKGGRGWSGCNGGGSHSGSADCGDATSLHPCDAGGIGCHGGGCHGGDLPADPFVALRVACGMLLGEDDFRVLAGNPRGKQRLHTAWLHGPGVVWGYHAKRDGDCLMVGPGLAVDGLGRELRLTTSQCLDLHAWGAERAGEPTTIDHSQATAGQAAEHGATYRGAAGTPAETGDAPSRRTLGGFVVARQDSCLTEPVPALADPCEITRPHDAYSRVVETVRLEIWDEPPPIERSYHRLWMLLGVEKIEGAAGKDVRDALEYVKSRPAADREAALRREIERLARCDAVDRRPAAVPGSDCPDGYPVAEDCDGVVVAELCVEVTALGECTTIGDVAVRPCEGQAAVPTSTLFELLSALLARLLRDDGAGADADGPRLLSVTWTQRRDAFSLQFDRPILERSWERAIEVSSLSEDGRGWRSEEIQDGGIAYADNTGTRVFVRLDGSPIYTRLRVVVHGTGRTPLFGSDPVVPFAGHLNGPPGTVNDGHDAADVQVFAALRPTSDPEAS